MLDRARRRSASTSEHDGERMRRRPARAARFRRKSADLFLGNAGTAVRPLTAALAVNGGDYRVHGVPRMHERPIGDLVDGLRQIGAQIDYEANDGFPPLQIHAGADCRRRSRSACAATCPASS